MSDKSAQATTMGKDIRTLKKRVPVAQKMGLDPTKTCVTRPLVALEHGQPAEIICYIPACKWSDFMHRDSSINTKSELHCILHKLSCISLCERSKV